MPVNAFNNDIKDSVGRGDIAKGLNPAVNYTFDVSAKTLEVTDASDYPTDDFRTIANLTVTDGNGKKVVGSIGSGDPDESPTDAATLNVSTLDASEGFRLDVTLVSDQRLTADGHANLRGDVDATGAVGSWAKGADIAG